MRLVLISFAAAIAALAVSAQPSSAQSPQRWVEDPQPWGSRAWCTQPGIFSDDWSGPHCAYDTYAQCRGTAYGEGLSCIQNPWYKSPATKKSSRGKARRTTR